MKICLNRAHLLLPLFFLILGSLAVGAQPQSNFQEAADERSEMALADINDVMERHSGELMALSGVVGVYVSALDDGTPCIKIMVIEKTADLENKIPKRLEGHPTVIVETGNIVPLRTP